MPKMIDAYGEYEPTLNKCGCIDKRTLWNIEHSLRTLYDDRQKRSEMIKSGEERDGDRLSTNEFVMKKTKSLLNVMRSIEECEDHPDIPTIKKTCDCARHVGNIDELTRSLLRNIELYKDITIGGAEVVLGGKHRKTTSIDIMEMIEDKTKEIAVEVNNYKRCCHPERKIPEITKEMLKGKSIIESIESTRKAIMTEEFKPIMRA